MLVIHKGLVWPSAWAALPVLGTALVILSQQEDSMLTTHPVAQWLGDRSYLDLLVALAGCGRLVFW